VWRKIPRCIDLAVMMVIPLMKFLPENTCQVTLLFELFGKGYTIGQTQLTGYIALGIIIEPVEDGNPPDKRLVLVGPRAGAEQ
jgi:hypothetical protein